MALLAVARLIDAADDRRLAQRLAQQLQALGTQRLHRPVGLGEEVMQGLRIHVRGLAQLGQ